MNGLRLPLMMIMTVVVLVSSVAATRRPQHLAQQPTEDCEYFVETGYYVCDEFLEFFETRGGLEIFGYPISEAFNDPSRGLLVQYFQRARMEWHPYNPEPYKVLLGLLAQELGYCRPPINAAEIPPFNNSLRHYFPETGHVVAYAFLDYFNEKGGLDIFGYPCSEFMYEDGYVVQYFQRARMEWHPEVVSGQRMRLTNLGEIYLSRIQNNELPQLVEGTALVTRLQVSASVRHIITGQGGRQIVFVYVTDQLDQPVPGAAVGMVVRYQSGDQIYELEPSDENGFTSHSFDILPAPQGRKVIIDVTAMYDELTAKTQTFFLPWW
ncbi:MAG: hypothetical protein DRI48_03365 [Chloroflexi bacterium]|nr:MAG: hypothetical protein DRI48_03365 [Chloroflexota bacterium]